MVRQQVTRPDCVQQGVLLLQVQNQGLVLVEQQLYLFAFLNVVVYFGFVRELSLAGEEGDEFEYLGSGLLDEVVGEGLDAIEEGVVVQPSQQVVGTTLQQRLVHWLVSQQVQVVVRRRHYARRSLAPRVVPLLVAIRRRPIQSRHLQLRILVVETVHIVLLILDLLLAVELEGEVIGRRHALDELEVS